MQEFLNQYPWLIPVLQIWTIPWKGFALWLAAKKDEKWWFIAMLLINTAGLVEIVYIFAIAKYRFPFLNKRIHNTNTAKGGKGDRKQ